LYVLIGVYQETALLLTIGREGFGAWMHRCHWWVMAEFLIQTILLPVSAVLAINNVRDI